jgi:hypothetical protein
MTTALILILIIVVGLVGAVYLSRFKLKRAMRLVVFVFRTGGATSPKTAKTLEELGLAVRGGLFNNMFKPRDYRPYALRALSQANILRALDDGRVYLSEDELEHSTLKDFAKIKPARTSQGSQNDKH